MRVLMLKEALPAGGAERQLALITEHLRDPWEVRVWTMGGGPFVDVIAAQGRRVDVDARAARLDMRPALSLWRLIRTWRPDVVHSWDWMSSAAALPLCRALGIPVIDGTIRNGIARRRRSLPLRLVVAGSRLVVANSRAGLAAWRVPAAKGRVVYNAFDPSRWTLAQPPANDGAPPADLTPSTEGRSHPRTVVMTGRMVARKDFSSVIAVAHTLDREQPDRWRFVLVGEGPDKSRLLAAAGDLVARGVVEFASPGLEVLPTVRETDIGVLMSEETVHREGCSNSIMEYMACGLPVVCSAGGGNPELVVDGETGFLVPAGDCRALLARLRTLDERPDVARSMGEAGRRRLRERFTVAHTIAGLEAVYREAVA